MALGLLRAVIDRLPTASLSLVPEADHGFRVPTKSGRSAAEVVEHRPRSDQCQRRFCRQ